MRATHAAALSEAAEDTLLTTGEAARILGVSRQQVVNLCEAGDLPHTLVGRHRRVRRSDVEAIRLARTRMSKQDRQALLLAYAVAGEIVRDPAATLTKAKTNLRAMQREAHVGPTRVWLKEWDSLLEGPLLALLNALTATTQRSRELRQNSPFAGVLSDDLRREVLDLATTAGRPNDA